MSGGRAQTGGFSSIPTFGMRGLGMGLCMHGPSRKGMSGCSHACALLVVQRGLAAVCAVLPLAVGREVGLHGTGWGHNVSQNPTFEDPRSVSLWFTST